MELGEHISSIIGVHKQTVFSILRHQDGIVFENLDREKAFDVAEYLTSKGFKAVAVPDSDVLPAPKFRLVRNVDVINDGLEIENPYGDREMISGERIHYMQTGWVEENLRAADERQGLFGDLFGVGRGVVEGPPWKRLTQSHKLGWVLHAAYDNDKDEVLQIIESKFYFDYQGDDFAPSHERFIRLLKDIDDFVPDDRVDPSVKLAQETDREVPDELKYNTLEDLEKRLRWSITLNNRNIQ